MVIVRNAGFVSAHAYGRTSLTPSTRGASFRQAFSGAKKKRPEIGPLDRAEGGSRTRTPLLAYAPETYASTNSATSAGYCVFQKRAQR